jgi:hypothetical protein
MNHLNRGTHKGIKSKNFISNPVYTFLYNFYTSNILSKRNPQLINISLR